LLLVLLLLLFLLQLVLLRKMGRRRLWCNPPMLCSSLCWAWASVLCVHQHLSTLLLPLLLLALLLLLPLLLLLLLLLLLPLLLLALLPLLLLLLPLLLPLLLSLLLPLESLHATRSSHPIALLLATMSVRLRLLRQMCCLGVVCGPRPSRHWVTMPRPWSRLLLLLLLLRW
jgi:hypothetical protein